MSESKEKIAEALVTIMNPDNWQKFITGFKKDGNPRALYDLVKDYIKYKKCKKKKNKKDKNAYSIYLKKNKKKKKKDKYWHI